MEMRVNLSSGFSSWTYSSLNTFIHVKSSQKIKDELKLELKVKEKQEFPGNPVVRTPRTHCRGPDSIHGQGTKIPPKKKKSKKSKTTTGSGINSIVLACLAW